MYKLINFYKYIHSYNYKSIITLKTSLLPAPWKTHSRCPSRNNHLYFKSSLKNLYSFSYYMFSTTNRKYQKKMQLFVMETKHARSYFESYLMLSFHLSKVVKALQDNCCITLVSVKIDNLSISFSFFPGEKGMTYKEYIQPQIILCHFSQRQRWNSRFSKLFYKYKK